MALNLVGVGCVNSCLMSIQTWFWKSIWKTSFAYANSISWFSSVEANFCVSCVLFGPPLEEWKGKGDSLAGLGREERLQWREWRTEIWWRGGLVGKDEIQKLAGTEEMEGKIFKYKEEEKARHRRLEILEEPRSWGQIVYVNNGRVIRRQLVQFEEMEHIRKGADILVMSGSLRWWLLAGWHQKGKNLVHRDWKEEGILNMGTNAYFTGGKRARHVSQEQKTTVLLGCKVW